MIHTQLTPCIIEDFSIWAEKQREINPNLITIFKEKLNKGSESISRRFLASQDIYLNNKESIIETLEKHHFSLVLSSKKSDFYNWLAGDITIANLCLSSNDIEALLYSEEAENLAYYGAFTTSMIAQVEQVIRNAYEDYMQYIAEGNNSTKDKHLIERFLSADNHNFSTESNKVLGKIFVYIHNAGESSGCDYDMAVNVFAFGSFENKKVQTLNPLNIIRARKVFHCDTNRDEEIELSFNATDNINAQKVVLEALNDYLGSHNPT